MRYSRHPWIRQIAVSLLFLLYLLCLIIFLSSYFPSDKYLIFSLLHLLTPVCLIFLLCSVAALLFFKQRKFLVVPALLLAVNMGNWSALLQISKKTLESDQSFKVLSYNVGFFSIPSVYSKQYFDSTSADRGTQIIDWMATQDAPVVCLQEFFTDGESKHHNYLMKLSSAGYSTNVFALPNPKNKTLRGLITCSKFPIVDHGKVFISDNRYNGASYTDLLIGRDTIRVVNVHLESMELYFGNKKLMSKFKHFWSHYKESMVTRTRQVKLLSDFIAKSPHPIIVAGDFNETPYSYNHKVIGERLTNAFEYSGNGFGTTFIEGVLPIRIDHQYFSSQFECGNFEVEGVKLSNHYPILARYQLKP